MSNLPIQFQSFNFNSSSVRIVIDPNQDLWFCGTDVCSILGYVNAPDAMKKHCKEAGIAKRYISHSSGRKEAIFINEPNLYRLIIKSRKPQAEKFEAWVFEEVLPQIRKTGQYSQPQQLALPEPEKKYTFEFTEKELLDLAWSWFAFVRGIHTFRHIHPAFQKLGSNMAGVIYGQGYDYSFTARRAHEIINRLTQHIEIDYNDNSRVLKHVRNFDPTFKSTTFDF